MEPEMAHVTELRAIQPEELPTIRDHLGDKILSVPVQYEHRFTDTADTRAPLVHCAENPSCGYERETHLDLSEDTNDEIDELLDAEPQTVSDVITRGNVVEFCESCFPDLAAWNTESDD